jgi:hypothetical protein
MTNTLRHPVGLFASVQVLGLVCMAAWQYVALALASPIWAIALILLFPGNFASIILTDKLFWGKGLSSVAVVASEIPVLLVVNAAPWFGTIRTFKIFR